MDNDSFTTTGVTGLAMIVGQLRAELDRLRDDKDRDLAALRTEFADFRAERETRERQIFDVVSGLAEAVKAFTTTAKGAGSTGKKPEAADDGPAPLPTRKAGETSRDWYKRLLTWAEDNDLEAPPKPATGPVANNRDYETKIARFYETD